MVTKIGPSSAKPSASQCDLACYGSGMSGHPAHVEARSSAAAVVVFDFDGTLVSRDSFLDFALRYCATRPLRLFIVSCFLPFAVALRLRSLKSAGSLLLWAMTVGTSTRYFVGALRRYAKSTLPRYTNEPIFAELTRHLGEGSRVIIATGTMPLLVRALLNARNLGSVPVVGSRLRRRWGGLVPETHCIGGTKRFELKRRFGIVEWSAVYTDSFADRSLLSRARDITLVDPSRRTLSRTRRLIDEATTALRVLRPE
jgi:phosphatidylglycerophosphatase C